MGWHRILTVRSGSSETVTMMPHLPEPPLACWVDSSTSSEGSSLPQASAVLAFSLFLQKNF